MSLKERAMAMPTGTSTPHPMAPSQAWACRGEEGRWEGGREAAGKPGGQTGCQWVWQREGSGAHCRGCRQAAHPGKVMKQGKWQRHNTLPAAASQPASQPVVRPPAPPLTALREESELPLPASVAIAPLLEPRTGSVASPSSLCRSGVPSGAVGPAAKISGRSSPCCSTSSRRPAAGRKAGRGQRRVGGQPGHVVIVSAGTAG